MILTEAEIDRLLAAAPLPLQQVRPFLTAGLTAPGTFLVGLGAVRQVGAVAAALTAGRRAVLVSDHVIAGTGAVAIVEGRLADAGFDVAAFLDVEPEPHVATIERVESLARMRGADVVIGLGGGSVLDVAKIAAIAIGSGHPAASHLHAPQGTSRAGRLPLILLPTTSGTGSEVSIFAVATMDGQKRSLVGPELVPHAAILDPLLSLSMPPKVTAATGLDALTHATEAVMHVAATPLNEMLSAGAIAAIMRALPLAVKDNFDLEARFAMSVASSLAMMSFNLSGGLWAHSASYVLTSHYKMPHGLGCALALPWLVDFNGAASSVVLDRLAPVFGGAPAARIRDLMESVNIPLSLSDHGVSEAELPVLAAEMLALYPRAANPVFMDCEAALVFWQKMHAGQSCRNAGPYPASACPTFQ